MPEYSLTTMQALNVQSESSIKKDKPAQVFSKFAKVLTIPIF